MKKKEIKKLSWKKREDKVLDWLKKHKKELKDGIYLSDLCKELEIEDSGNERFLKILENSGLFHHIEIYNEYDPFCYFNSNLNYKELNELAHRIALFIKVWQDKCYMNTKVKTPLDKANEEIDMLKKLLEEAEERLRVNNKDELIRKDKSIEESEDIKSEIKDGYSLRVYSSITGYREAGFSDNEIASLMGVTFEYVKEKGVLKYK